MNARTFETVDGLKLIVKNRKSAVIFEIEEKQTIDNQYQFCFEFAPQVFTELIKYIEDIANKSWTNFVPKEANSLATDYYEYYDRELDNNGYMTLRENGLLIERPSLDSKKLYQFNKKKMESFIYDLKKR